MGNQGVDAATSVKVPERQGRRPVAVRVCFEEIVFVMMTGSRGAISG